ncbi:hypothetical protein GCM10011371_09810 [Novosphingobium marinum]|nr:hypothetical protein [Novosphingobium marinum]GGC24159.1 hypothetical protein GCM10011371_09810 [Novosphingobium marinum]
MEIDTLQFRQDVLAWRDEILIAAAAQINRAAIESREHFETLLPFASFKDALWDPDAFATLYIDPQMLERTEMSLKRILVDSAQKLSSLNPELDGFANAMIEATEQIAFPECKSVDEQGANLRQSDIEDSRSSSERAEGLSAKLGHLGRTIGKRIARTSENVGVLVRDRAGVHARLRQAAAQRIDHAWMGEGKAPRSVLSQVALMVDEVASHARLVS